MSNYEYEDEAVLELEEPRKFSVILHNDEITSAAFVIKILQKIFSKTLPEAEETMEYIHKKGQAVCGVYPHEIAQTKANQVKTKAAQKEFPLLATIEED